MMINREKAINLLNNMEVRQGKYIYETNVPSDTGFYFKSLGFTVYCILVIKDYENGLVEDIIFRDKKDLKELLDKDYHPYFRTITRELADRMIIDFPGLSIYKACNGRVHLIHKGVAIADVAE